MQAKGSQCISPVGSFVLIGDLPLDLICIRDTYA